MSAQLPPHHGKRSILKPTITIIFYLSVFLIHSTHSVLNEEYLYPTAINSRLKSYEFVLSEGIVQADNFEQVGYLINGQFPGPTIFVNQFDMLRITVVNLLTVATTIHFHGILQEHSVGSDGVPWVTQHPIYPNETFVYEIILGVQTGTYMYHGHLAYDNVFIKGIIIIRDNPSYWQALGMEYRFEPGYEHSFILGEVYHYSLTQFAVDVLGPWKGEPPVESIHINGYSYGEWGENNGNAPGYEVVKVVPGRTYRFRIINMASNTMLRFRIEGHTFRVIEMDGILCLPVWTDRVEINAGQRYSIMVKMDKQVDNYWIHTELMSPFIGGPDNGRAILNYVGAPDPEYLRKVLFLNTTKIIPETTWILPLLMPNRLLPMSEVYDLPIKHNQRIMIDTTMKIENKIYKFLINGHHFENPPITYLKQVRSGVDIARNSKQVYEVLEGHVVDIVFQNRVMDDGFCIQHPWHLHGHSFWLVAEGSDTVDLSTLDLTIERNVRNGRLQFRDVITLFAKQKIENGTAEAGCGWAVIRFVANNPGVWMAHCHVTTHLIMGKQFVIYEYKEGNPLLLNE